MHPRKFVRDSLGTALSQTLARFAMLLRGVVAAAALGPLGYGAWNALNLLLDYGAYASAGALQGLDLRLPPAAARGDQAEAQRVMAGAWSVVAIGGGLFALATVLCLMGGFGRIVSPWGWGPPLLMLVAALLQLAIQYHAGALRAQGEFRAVSEAHALQALLGGGLGMALVSRFGVWGLLWGWLAGSLAALLWMRRGPLRPPLAPGALREGLSLARLGFPVFALFTASLVLRSVDRIAFVRYAGTEGLGQYSIGLTAAGLILFQDCVGVPGLGEDVESGHVHLEDRLLPKGRSVVGQILAGDCESLRQGDPADGPGGVRGGRRHRDRICHE